MGVQSDPGTGKSSPGRYRYVILLASFLALVFNASLEYAAGVFHVALLQTYNSNLTLTVWIGSLYFCMYALAGPFGSFVLNHTNCRTTVILSGILGFIGLSANYFVQDIRWLFLTYSLLAGGGAALCYTGALVVLTYHFQDRLTTVTGICICGQAVGQFIHAPLADYLIRSYGLRGAFLIYGAIVLNSSLCGMLMRTEPTEKKSLLKKSEYTENKETRNRFTAALLTHVHEYAQLLKMKTFLCFWISTLACGMGLSAVYLYLPTYLQNKGVSKQDSSFAVSFIGVGGLVSRFLTGFAAHDSKVGSGLMFSGLHGLMGFVSLLVPFFTSSRVTACAYGALLGLYSGGVYVLFCPMVFEMVGKEKIVTGFGFISFVSGVGQLTGPPLIGAILETIRWDYVVFLSTAVVYFTATLFACLSTMYRTPSGQVGKQQPEDAINDLEVEVILQTETT